MRISYLIQEQTVSTTARGILSIIDVIEHVREKKRAGIELQPELFDARDVTLDLSASDLKTIAAEVARAIDGKQPGPVAVVTNSAFLFGLAKAYAELTRTINPNVAVFYDYEKALCWLNGVRCEVAA
jgi:hypothetical protein